MIVAEIVGCYRGIVVAADVACLPWLLSCGHAAAVAAVAAAPVGGTVDYVETASSSESVFPRDALLLPPSHPPCCAC